MLRYKNMNNEKIDLILRGVNLLVMNSELNIEFKTDFNKSFRECFDKEESKEEDCCEMPERDFAFQKKQVTISAEDMCECGHERGEHNERGCTALDYNCKSKCDKFILNKGSEEK